MILLDMGSRKYNVQFTTHLGKKKTDKLYFYSYDTKDLFTIVFKLCVVVEMLFQGWLSIMHVNPGECMPCNLQQQTDKTHFVNCVLKVFYLEWFPIAVWKKFCN